MTTEEKQLLLKDLCARLPYGVKVYVNYSYSDGEKIVDDKRVEVLDLSKLDWFLNGIEIKPYLRKFKENGIECYRWKNFKTVSENMQYLIENHYDINHLIERDLAIEASEGMYNIKTK